RAGRSVLVLERRDETGGAVQSAEPFPGVAARLSRFSYLVSLLPAPLASALGLALELRPRAVASYTPAGETGLLVARDGARTQESMRALGAGPGEFRAWQELHARLERVARRVFPTLTEPLRSR